jgi:hypothetical protein
MESEGKTRSSREGILFIHSQYMKNVSFPIIQCWIVVSLANNELERTQREMVVAPSKALSHHPPRGTAVYHKNLTHDNLFLSLDLNLESPKYKAGVLIV